MHVVHSNGMLQGVFSLHKLKLYKSFSKDFKHAQIQTTMDEQQQQPQELPPLVFKDDSDDENESHFDDDDDVGEVVQESHMEADPDEDDPEMITCPQCSHKTHMSKGKCEGNECTYTFQFTASGHHKDGFVVDENEVIYDESSDEESEEEMYYSDETSSDDEDTKMDGNEQVWCGNESDEEWTP